MSNKHHFIALCLISKCGYAEAKKKIGVINFLRLVRWNPFHHLRSPGTVLWPDRIKGFLLEWCHVSSP